MYQYTEFDRQFVRARAAQFRDQLQRNLSGELADDDFKPLRLQNGWYVQRHAPMLRLAVPYGELNATQLHQLAVIAREFDQGWGHFTTRQNLQYNWIPLPKAADVMDKLAAVDMHGIQTSGNCIRNITSDALAGIAADETVDPRPYAEVMRQWSTLHPEFAFLPRKFKIAITGAAEDRAAIGWHDVGLRVLKNAAGEVGFNVLVGGTNITYNALAAARTSVNTKMDRPSLRRVIAALKKQNARLMTQLLGTNPDFNKISVAPSYWAIVHTDAEASIRDLPGFKDAADYPKPSPYENEIGSCEGIRFLLSQVFVPFADAGGAAGGNFKSTTGTSCDVYPVLVFAKWGTAIVPLKGPGAIIPMVVNRKPSDSDPMAQRTKASWKAYHTAAILNQNWLMRWEIAVPS